MSTLKRYALLHAKDELGQNYGPWRIVCNLKPIPDRGHDYDWFHKDFDGAEDANDNRWGNAASVEDCITHIHELEDDHE